MSSLHICFAMLFKSVTCNVFATKQFIDLCLTLTLCLFCPSVCHFFSFGPGHDNILLKFADIVERNFLGPKKLGVGALGPYWIRICFFSSRYPQNRSEKCVVGCSRHTTNRNLHTRSLRIQSSHDTCTF